MNSFSTVALKLVYRHGCRKDIFHFRAYQQGIKFVTTSVIWSVTVRFYYFEEC